MAHTPVDHTLKITVSGNGDIGHTGTEPYTVFKNDRLEWGCAVHEIWIVFAGGISPFIPNAPSLYAPAGGTTGLKKIKKPKYKKEPFKYSIAVNHNGTIIVTDPVVIVDDDGGGPGKAAKKRSSKKKTAKK